MQQFEDEGMLVRHQRRLIIFANQRQMW